MGAMDSYALVNEDGLPVPGTEIEGFCGDLTRFADHVCDLTMSATPRSALHVLRMVSEMLACKARDFNQILESGEIAQ